MAQLTSYYIGILTNNTYTPDTYEAAAGKLLTTLHTIFGTQATVETLTKPSSALRQFHTEVEMSHDEHLGLVARCVIDLTGEQRIQLDKSKLSSLLKASTDYPKMKIEKRAVEGVVMPATPGTNERP